MVSVTSADAQNHFGELLERAQRGPVAVTRHGRTVAYVVSADSMDGPDLGTRRADAARWYTAFCQAHAPTPAAAALTDDDVNGLVHALR